MTSEPPFDHPSDHTKYGPPPPEPPHPLPWILTPGFKSGCALICVALMLTCCLSATATATIQGLMIRLDQMNKHLEDISKKLDNVPIKPKEEPKKDDPKKEEPKKEDAIKKEK